MMIQDTMNCPLPSTLCDTPACNARFWWVFGITSILAFIGLMGICKELWKRRTKEGA